MAEKRPRMKRPLPVAALLESVFVGKPAQKRIREAKAWQFWEEAVGSHIAGKAVPAAFRDGTLTVRVCGSAWIQQLSLMKADIISHLNSAIGEPLVTDLFFRQGTVHKIIDKVVENPVRIRAITEAEKKFLSERTSSVVDPELRDAFISLFSSQLAADPRS